MQTFTKADLSVIGQRAKKQERPDMRIRRVAYYANFVRDDIVIKASHGETHHMAGVPQDIIEEIKRLLQQQFPDSKIEIVEQTVKKSFWRSTKKHFIRIDWS
jgi:hypothetical protein